MPLKLLSTEVSYVQSVLEETLEEVDESGTFLALRESVAKSRERNKEKNEIGYIINNALEKISKTLILAFEANSALSRKNEIKIVKITHMYSAKAASI